MGAPNLQIVAAMDMTALRDIKEHDFSVAVREFAESNGWLVEYRYRSATKLANGQWRGTGPKGFPDMFMARGERAVAIELKAESGRTTPEQRKWLSVLAETPVEQYLWKPRDAAEAIERLA